MSISGMSQFLEHLQHVTLVQEDLDLSDRQLLEKYLHHRTESVLASLILRHGPMVWGVCRRVLDHYQDAEDAFQATFLVFVRKVTSIRSRDLLANWLYGVAYQTARKAKSNAIKRESRERQVNEMPEPEVVSRKEKSDLEIVLDEELHRLPEKYRSVLILCELEGKTRSQSAQLLGVPEGTVAGRLARARDLLSKRLARRGVVLSGSSLATILPDLSSASVPSPLLSSTIKAASQFASSHSSGISPEIVALTEGVLKTMLISKVKSLLILFCLVSFLGTGVGVAFHLTNSTQQAQAQSQEKNKGIDKPDEKQANAKASASTSRIEPKYKGKPLSYWFELFQKAETQEEWNNASVPIIAFGADAAPVFPKLMEMLDDRSSEYRGVIQHIFVQLGPDAKPIVPDLVKGLKEKTARDPQQFMTILSSIGPAAKEAIPVLIQLLNDIDSLDLAIPTLCSIGPEAKEVIPSIRKALLKAKSEGHLDPMYGHSSDILNSLYKLGPSIAPVLFEFLKDDSPRVRISIVENLGQIDPPVKEAVPPLKKMIQENDPIFQKTPYLRKTVALNLWAIGGNDSTILDLVIPIFTDLLKEKDRHLVGPSASALGALGAKAKSALPAMELALKHEQESVRQEVETAIKKIKAAKE